MNVSFGFLSLFWTICLKLWVVRERFIWIRGSFVNDLLELVSRSWAICLKLWIVRKWLVLWSSISSINNSFQLVQGYFSLQRCFMKNSRVYNFSSTSLVSFKCDKIQILPKSFPFSPFKYHYCLLVRHLYYTIGIENGMNHTETRHISTSVFDPLSSVVLDQTACIFTRCDDVPILNFIQMLVGYQE